MSYDLPYNGQTWKNFGEGRGWLSRLVNSPNLVAGTQGWTIEGMDNISSGSYFDSGNWWNQVKFISNGGDTMPAGYNNGIFVPGFPYIAEVIVRQGTENDASYGSHFIIAQIYSFTLGSALSSATTHVSGVRTTLSLSGTIPYEWKDARLRLISTVGTESAYVNEEYYEIVKAQGFSYVPEESVRNYAKYGTFNQACSSGAGYAYSMGIDAIWRASENMARAKGLTGTVILPVGDYYAWNGGTVSVEFPSHDDAGYDTYFKFIPMIRIRMLFPDDKYRSPVPSDRYDTPKTPTGFSTIKDIVPDNSILDTGGFCPTGVTVREITVKGFKIIYSPYLCTTIQIDSNGVPVYPANYMHFEKTIIWSAIGV